ncbi:MAG TPA: hypothetical protein VN598_08200 [Usitatibacter sp.]|nr:hypothetical protein [Usitatibacter sp.]
MQPLLGSDWQKALWKIVRNPAFEVVAAIVVVLFATWLVIETETDRHHTLFPVPVLAK